MFKRFLKSKKEEKPVQSNFSNRDLFNELFPLTEENKSKFKNSFNSIFEKMFEKEQVDKLLNYSRNYKTKETQFGNLIFNDMSWNSIDSTETKLQYISPDSDPMVIEIFEPNGEMKKENSEAIMLAYRDWTRKQTVKIGGGLIMCEEVLTENGIVGYESITKIPKREGRGMDYTYFLNLNDYKEQKMYQFRVMIFEMNPTGLRDNISMHPICDITDTDIGELMSLYRQDPYNKEFKEGNLMNISEKEEFDSFFPFHPLSIIRNEIKPNIINSVRFN
ncbi:hypothetical protein [uncultured Kordia sp.]|uniref:hypothetical protein n=1 Tax=uncultured Kordia sp. TaxID=507699 RepID=UPI0026049D9E|nr:hypothetical protein [uncultured Kordia sp.]